MTKRHSKPSHSGTNQVRIIAGQFRSRRLSFTDAAGLRPTPDRVRESVFNWLQAYLPGAVCMDLFAGTGVMGFESLSRGAQQVTFIEKQASAVSSLRHNAETLKVSDQVEIRQGDTLQILPTLPVASVDIVFADPPYGQGLIAKCLQSLHNHPVLKPGGLLYVEQESTLPAPDSTPEWCLLKDKQAGQVGYYLMQYQPQVDGSEG